MFAIFYAINWNWQHLSTLLYPYKPLKWATLTLGQKCNRSEESDQSFSDLELAKEATYHQNEYDLQTKLWNVRNTSTHHVAISFKKKSIHLNTVKSETCGVLLKMVLNWHSYNITIWTFWIGKFGFQQKIMLFKK